MKRKSPCSLKYCEKLLQKLIELTVPANRKIDYDDLIRHFRSAEHIRIRNALETLEYLECVSLLCVYDSEGGRHIATITLTSGGVAYFVSKSLKNRERWIDRIIGFCSAVLLYLITEEFLSPIIGLLIP